MYVLCVYLCTYAYFLVWLNLTQDEQGMASNIFSNLSMWFITELLEISSEMFVQNHFFLVG